MMRNVSLIAALVALLVVFGCGKGSKDKKEGPEAFRVPDSLLAPIEGYHLTVDDYHVINGGVLANAQIELRYPSSEIARYLALKVFGLVKTSYEKVTKEIGRPAAGKIVLIGEQGITNRIAQVAINRRSGGKSPFWLKEALATRVAGEEGILKIQQPEFQYEGRNMNPSPEAIERAIAEGTNRGDSRIAYYAACRMLENLLKTHSMEKVLSFLDRLGEGTTLDQASREAFGVDYGALIDGIRVDR
ncbi:MAG: hypothetical protein NTW97_10640 [Candidatus Krumholzibacteria bacterium]|nr:hypothetical protein [Candidatus Krumholzibacteria bacterium]